MFKRVINVPKGIRFISDWKEFKLEETPHILDKKIPGCGFTEWCLTNNQPTILCSPRRVLLKNKSKQHSGEVYYFQNNFEEVLEIEKDLTKIDKRAIESKTETFEEKEAKKKFYQEATKNLLAYVNARESRNLPPKILVTYDSFHIVKDILKNKLLLYDFQIIVDEFQSLWVDARFKADTEFSFMNHLQNLQKVCFVSATPMMDEYLDMLEEFKYLPYIELDWAALDPGRVITPKLTVRVLKSIPEVTEKIVNEYRSGNYTGKYILDKSGNPVYVESKEAVIFVNSVNNIIKIIKSNNIKPEEVNILIADTDENKKKIKRRLGKKFEIGEVPLKGEPHKMFTLCTRTVYLGADFYSDNARTFIISDANIETLAVDISLDLPQILGRQRLNENPWKNEASFFFKPITEKNVYDEKLYGDFQEKKKKATIDALNLFLKGNDSEKETLVSMCLRGIKANTYKYDYVSVNKKFNPATMEYEAYLVENELVRIAEKRAFDMQQLDYKDRFVVFNTIDEALGIDEGNEKVKEFFRIFEQLPSFSKKLKYLCESDLDSTFIKTKIIPAISEPHFDEYYNVLGPERCKSLSYDTSRLRKDLSVMSFSTEILTTEIYKEFSEGQKFSKAVIKQKLQSIYDLVGYSKKAKATDLSNYFEVKDVTILRPERTNGFELIKKLK